MNLKFKPNLQSSLGILQRIKIVPHFKVSKTSMFGFKQLSKRCCAIISILMISTLFLACENTARDTGIDRAILGKWEGNWKTKRGKDTINAKTTLEIVDNTFYYNMGGSTGSNKIRAFINPSTGDTLIERKNFMNSLFQESGYMKFHQVNKNEISLIFIFKMSENSFASDHFSGYYMKRVN